ncbi:hypothetical protein N8I77_003231 [Diaporthe amygdali]|uniref:Uncharacterized protein n=1 Tax=Phomopsis amygdali TaxID=1214568 RepID=A0AAD9W4P8_PHOAM|nr:hypothetical protein N8I77_003231 [Diaporthe amygdali]
MLPPGAMKSISIIVRLGSAGGVKLSGTGLQSSSGRSSATAGSHSESPSWASPEKSNGSPGTKPTEPELPVAFHAACQVYTGVSGFSADPTAEILRAPPGDPAVKMPGPSLLAGRETKMPLSMIRVATRDHASLGQSRPPPYEQVMTSTPLSAASTKALIRTSMSAPDVLHAWILYSSKVAPGATPNTPYFLSALAAPTMPSTWVPWKEQWSETSASPSVRSCEYET